MALAALCSRVQSYLSKVKAKVPKDDHLEPFRSLSFHAFVVDHASRKDSTTEAYAVSKILEQRGNSGLIYT